MTREGQELFEDYVDTDFLAIPTWQSECAKPEKRGRNITISGGIIVFGVMVAVSLRSLTPHPYFERLTVPSTVLDRLWFLFPDRYRPLEVPDHVVSLLGLSNPLPQRHSPLIPASQSFFTLLVMAGLLFLPDSPRWLLMRGRTEESRSVIARLADKDLYDEEVEIEMTNIREALDAQGDGKFRMSELFAGGPSQNRRRVLLGIAAQFFQQICGINLITYYATFVFENSLGFGPEMSRLLAALNGTEYFLASLIAIPLIERVGRRKLMLFGAFGMMSSMIILAGTSSTATINEFGAPVLELTYGVVATVFLFGFNTFFAIGWLGMTWL